MKRHVLIPLAGAAVAALLAGCTTPGAGGDAKITLTFANADPEATWANVIAAYEEENPNVDIKQLNIPYAQYTSTINQRLGTGGGGGIDLMVVDAGGAAIDWDNRGFLADVSDLSD